MMRGSRHLDSPTPGRAFPARRAPAAAVVLAFGWMLGCSSGPSESDIRAAFEAQIDEAARAAEGFAGKGTADRFKVEIHSVEKLGCNASGDGAYLCDVKVDATAPLMGRTSQASTVRLRKTGDGWVLVSQQ